MKRTPGGESKVPEIVGREALRDEVYNFYFILKVTLCMLSDKEESLFQGVLVFIVKTKSVGFWS